MTVRRWPAHARRGLAAACCAAPLVAVPVPPALAQAASGVAPYGIVGDAIPAPLTASPGDPARGRAIVVDRQAGLCLLCHAGPFPEERFQGTLAPDLRGVGARLSAGQLRLRIVDSRTVHPTTTMPSYHRVEGLARVGAAWRGRPILSAQEVEDVVALLEAFRP